MNRGFWQSLWVHDMRSWVQNEKKDGPRSTRVHRHEGRAKGCQECAKEEAFANADNFPADGGSLVLMLFGVLVLVLVVVAMIYLPWW